jgi:predicted alpha/beta-hydrolase family hydrolase
MEHHIDEGGVRGVLHLPEHATGDGLALTHGAGSNSNTPLLIALARTFAEAGVAVLRYDLPFRVARPSGSPFPAGAARDREGVQTAVTALRQYAPRRVFAGGHSYGGRQTAMAAAEHPDLAAGLLLLAYPLHPPRKPEQLRTAFFPELRTPALFVHGTRDPFASIEELRAAVAQIPAHTDILVVERSGHDLKPVAQMGGEILARMLS